MFHDLPSASVGNRANATSPVGSPNLLTAVAVSGGADSLRSLALLKAEGRSVLALHARFLPVAGHSRQVESDLAGVCRSLGVRLEILDLTRQFEHEVIAPFIRAYGLGLTPNPCAVCNAAMKFGLLADAASTFGADRMATGHYARTYEHPVYGPVLGRGADPAKDQSYFLALVPAGRILNAIFPLAGRFKRDSASDLAAFGLTPPLPSESQEICFIPNDDYRSFLATRGGLPDQSGPIVLADGRHIGQHAGLWRYTHGQRRGLGVAWSEPLYVLKKRVLDNTLMVGPATELNVPSCRVREFNVLVPRQLWPDDLLVQTRYRQTPKPVRLIQGSEQSGRLTLEFLTVATRPAPGQSAVLYTTDGVVLGGGIIVSDNR